tara:strand:+ start:2095 stop:2667 length:573 start_codon:yes stop_codon:yes gene_type:complete
MGFINNQKDNFLPSSHPWGDDVTRYSIPSNKPRISLPTLDYDTIKRMLEEMSSTYKSMPMCKDKMRLKDKMMSIIQEIKKRDELEEATAIERNDSFESNIVEGPALINEVQDVVTDEIQNNIIENPQLADNFEDEPNFQDLDDADDLDGLDDDEEMDYFEDEMSETDNADTTNLLLAGLIVICVLTILKK